MISVLKPLFSVKIGHQAATFEKSIQSTKYIITSSPTQHSDPTCHPLKFIQQQDQPQRNQKTACKCALRTQWRTPHRKTGDLKDGRADNRSCRLTGAATFTGVGIYALRQAQLQGTFERVRPKGGSLVGGQVTAVIGIGESFYLIILVKPRWGWGWGWC